MECDCFHGVSWSLCMFHMMNILHFPSVLNDSSPLIPYSVILVTNDLLLELPTTSVIVLLLT